MKAIFETDLYKKLKKEKAQMYSYSQLTEFKQCEKKYWLNKVAYCKDVDKQNVYTIFGSLVDGILEEEYEFGLDNKTMLEKYEYGFNNNFTVNGKRYNFMSQKNYVESYASAKHYLTNYKRDPHMIKMKDVVAFPIGDYMPELEGAFFYGECDFVLRNENGGIEIGDFKTSTIFKGKDLQDKAMQLVLYAIAYEYMYGEKVEKIFFDFIKYSSRYGAPFIRTDEHCTTEKYYKYVELTDEIKENAIEFLLNSICLIQAKEKHPNDWEYNNSNTFFCNNLCEYHGQCESYVQANTKKVLTQV